MHVLAAIGWSSWHVLSRIHIPFESSSMIVNCGGVVVSMLVWGIVSVEHIWGLESLDIVQYVFDAFKHIGACPSLSSFHAYYRLLSSSSDIVLLVSEWWLRSLIIAKSLLIRDVLEAACRLIKILLRDPSEVTSHGTCPLSSRSLRSYLVICVLSELNLRWSASPRLNRVTCLRDRRLRELLVMARVLLEIDTLKVTNALVVLTWSHLHLSDICET